MEVNKILKIAVMQPYFFPYIGYFQLINSADIFIFYDDVNFIKNGWINRNRILLNNEAHYITIQLKEASSNKLINEVKYSDNRVKIIKTIEQAYNKAPFFNDVMPVILDCLVSESTNICELAILTVKSSCKYLNITTELEISSDKYKETKGLGRIERLVNICKSNGSDCYINPSGGNGLYNKDDFNKFNTNLYFIHSNPLKYKQFNNIFIPSLSIIDVMMFNSRDEISKMLNQYQLI